MLPFVDALGHASSMWSDTGLYLHCPYLVEPAVELPGADVEACFFALDLELRKSQGVGV